MSDVAPKSSVFAVSDQTLIQPGEEQLLSLTFPHVGTVEVGHPLTVTFRLTALSQGCIVEPQPTVLDRMVSFVWVAPDLGLFFPAYDPARGLHTVEVPPDSDFYGEINIRVIADSLFGISRRGVAYANLVDAIEITALVEARLLVTPAVPSNNAPDPAVTPYCEGVEAPLG
jgi:hypothetical protein